jgi:serine/threonine-protein kinase
MSAMAGFKVPWALPERFQVLRVLGSGGMGTVLLARERELGRLVALKFLRETGPLFLQRFRREARLMARLAHPAIVPVYEFAGAAERPYLALAYLDGGNLAQARLAPEALARTLHPVTDALASAHRHGIVHRDVKPENVLINELGQPMLTDFGLARLLFFDNYSVSGGKVIAGTPAYMAPEQILSPGDVDARTDQFCLGAVIHEMLTGSDAIPKSNDHRANILARLEVTWPTLAEVGVQAPGSLQDMLSRMLQREAADRFQSDDELLEKFVAAGEDLGLVLERY